jgi:VCBS repeat-containing protein
MKQMLRCLGYITAGLVAIAVFGGGKCTPDVSPMIFSLTASPDSVPRNGMSTVTCDAGDGDTDPDDLHYTWSATQGSITLSDSCTKPTGSSTIGQGIGCEYAYWMAPDMTGTYTVSVTVEDDGVGTKAAEESVEITVLDQWIPEIDSLTADPATVEPGGTSTITCAASDKDGDTLTYVCIANGGTLSYTSDKSKMTWQATERGDQLLDPGIYKIYVEVSDGKNTAGETVEVRVLGPNRPPEIDSVTIDPEAVAPGGTARIDLYVSDPDGDNLTVTWKALDGGILQGGGLTVSWTASDIFANFLPEDYYYILITVDDGRGGQDSDTVKITVEEGAGGTTCPGGH